MLQLWFIANTILWPIFFFTGTVNILLNEIVLVLGGGLWLIINRRVSASTIKVSLAFLAYFAFSCVITAIGPCTNGFQKSMVTALMLAFFILLGWETGYRATSGDWLKLQRTSIVALAVALAAFFVEFLMPSWFPHQAGARYGGKLSGLFTEPSHAGFSLFACIAILLIAENSKMRRIGWLMLVAVFIASRSSTLIIFLAAWILYRLLIQRKLRQAVGLLLLSAAAIAAGSAINYDRLVAPTIDRIAGVSDANDLEAANASSLVYLQGWEDMWANVVRTRGMGLGFNRMGCDPIPDVPARALLLIETSTPNLNADDGSFLFAKVVSEAGVLGIVFYIAVIWWWFSIERKLLLYSDHESHAAGATQAALIFCFVAASFVRSTGYFAGTFLLLVVAISGTWKWQKALPAKGLVSPLKQGN